MTAVFHHSAQRTLLILVILLTLLLGSPPAARADEPAQRTVVVMPFTPPAGEETDGLGAALQNMAENTLVLHPEVREIYFLNIIEQLFPTREHALQWLADKADLPREALKKAKVDAVLYESLTHAKGQPAVQAHWLASGMEYSATLPIDIASGLHQFRLELFSLLKKAGLPMPEAQQAKALYKEQTSLAALQAHGKGYAHHFLGACRGTDKTYLLKPYEAAVQAAPMSYLALNISKELHEKALSIRRRSLGEEHPDTAISYSNIAGILRVQGNYTAAREFHEKALTIRRKVLGEKHPRTALSLSNLATVLNALGENDKPLPYKMKPSPSCCVC